MRALWRSSQGLGLFTEGDASVLTRWVMALALAVLGEGVTIPISTDSEIVSKAKKALPRKLKKLLADECAAVIRMSAADIRSWAVSGMYTADRFAMLATSDFGAAIPVIVEEVAGDSGLRRLAEKPAKAVGMAVRCKELFSFAISSKYAALQEDADLITGGDDAS
jgi:hypothetical protein